MLDFTQIAAMNLHYQRVGFHTFLDSLEELDIKSFELWAGSPHFCVTDSYSPPVKAMKKVLRERGFKAVCLTPEQCEYPYNIAAREDILRKRSCDYFTTYLEWAAELEIDKMLLTSGWGYYDETQEEAWKRCLDSIDIILSRAQELGVAIAFEILLPEESNLVNSLESTLRVMRAFPSRFMQCCLDTVPVCFEGKTLAEYFSHPELKDRISHIHLNDGEPDGHLTWGDGSQPLEEHLETLDEVGYSGHMTLELGDTGYFEDPHGALRRGLETLRNRSNIWKN